MVYVKRWLGRVETPRLEALGLNDQATSKFTGFLSLWETIAGSLVSAPQRLPQCFRLFVSGLRVPVQPFSQA